MIGRFINADAFASTGQGILGNNMFAYCGNNPVNRNDASGSYSISIYYAAFGESSIMTVAANKKGGDNWLPNRNKRKGSDKRKPTGDRERNVKHPNGEEHSRIPKGNGRGIRRCQAVAFEYSSILDTPTYSNEPVILVTPAQNSILANWDSIPTHTSLSNSESAHFLMVGVIGCTLLVAVCYFADMDLMQINP